MPNWTLNTIRAEGSPQELRAFLGAVKWQDQLFDFNRLIPMPKILKHTGTGARIIDGKKVRSWYVTGESRPLDSKENVRLFTPEEEALLEEIGANNWYDWSVENWGTKWNACRVQLSDKALDQGRIEIRFETAWSEPAPVIEKMFEAFPRISFFCEFDHEDEDEPQYLERRANP